jgi:hypothetical protein
LQAVPLSPWATSRLQCKRAISGNPPKTFPLSGHGRRLFSMANGEGGCRFKCLFSIGFGPRTGARSDRTALRILPAQSKARSRRSGQRMAFALTTAANDLIDPEGHAEGNHDFGSGNRLLLWLDGSQTSGFREQEDEEGATDGLAERKKPLPQLSYSRSAYGTPIPCLSRSRCSEE